MKKNKLILTIGILSILSCFKVAAKLIPITVGANDTFTLAAFISDNKGKTYKIDQYTSKNISKKTTQNPHPDFAWYTFDTTKYKGAQKSKGQYPHYLHLAINETATGDNNGNTAKAILQTIKAPRGTFKILGINPMTGKINKNAGFIVTVK